MKALFDGQLPEAVMFDLDGTLVDSVPDLADAIDRTLISLDCEPAGEDTVRCWVGNGAQMLVRRALAGQLDVPEQLDLRFDVAYTRFLEFYAQQTSDRSELYPGVLECLQAFSEQNVPMAVVTNKPMQFTTPMLEGLGLSAFFSVVLGGDSLPVKKPDPQPLFVACEQLGSQPERTLMVGDSMNDVKAARAAGCPVVCVPYGYNHGEPISDSQPDQIVSRLDALFAG